MLAALLMSSLLPQVPSQAEIKRHLQTEIVGRWIPRAIDAKGGFHQNYDFDWKELPDDSRGVVYQARLTWLASIGGNNEVAEHGVKFLMDRMWDKKNGGFWWSVGLDGKPSAEKHTYGNAFALYALARHANMTGLLKDREAATRAFEWLETKARDPKFGGWFETLDGANKPIVIGDPGSADSIGTPYGVRSMNTTIHILEALVEYVVLMRKEIRTGIGNQPGLDASQVHPIKDGKLALGKVGAKKGIELKRLEEAFKLVRDRFVTKDGELWYYHAADYEEPLSDMDSYGHELETAYLLLEAAEVLGKPNDKETWRKAKLLVDHCLEVAWDEKNGGFFYEGHIGGGPSDRKKIWWTTAEGLNALRIFAQKFGGIYQKRYAQLWKFVLEHQVDKVQGGWHPSLDENNVPITSVKSDAWTEGYHQGRAIFLATGAEMYSHHK